MSPGPDGDHPSGVVGSRIYLVRHGQTSLNAAGVLRGRLDPPLDDVGRHEAKELGSALADRAVGLVGLVVSSPLVRAVQTAQAIAAQLGLSPSTDPRLIDRDYGRWAGSRREDIEAHWGSLDAAPDVEPLDDVRSRAWEALDDFASESAGGSAVVVTHDAVIRICLADADPLIGDPDVVPQDTGRMNTLDHRDGHWSVVRINEVPTRDST